LHSKPSPPGPLPLKSHDRSKTAKKSISTWSNTQYQKTFLAHTMGIVGLDVAKESLEEYGPTHATTRHLPRA
jgi:hypothetical protein